MKSWLLFLGLLHLGIAATSIMLAFAPTTEFEGRLWKRLRVRRCRHWVTRRRSRRTPTQDQPLQGVAKQSRQNILWHALLTGVFASLAFQAARTEILVLQVAALLLVVPALGYFGGTVIQREKLAIIARRMGEG